VYEALSTIMFLSPEVAAVGINEQEARRRCQPYRVAVLRNQLVSRNIAMRSTEGFLKLLADPAGRILGLRVVGPQASSTIQGTAFLIENHGTLEQIDRCLHPHPAIPEGVQECARLLLGKSLLKPGILGPALLRCGEG
jgi:dihydrolipoamide dehydrogenase